MVNFGQGWFLAFGMYKLTTEHKTKEDLKKWVEQNPWEVQGSYMIALMEAREARWKLGAKNDNPAVDAIDGL